MSAAVAAVKQISDVNSQMIVSPVDEIIADSELEMSALDQVDQYVIIYRLLLFVFYGCSAQLTEHVE